MKKEFAKLTFDYKDDRFKDSLEVTLFIDEEGNYSSEIKKQ